MGTLRKGKPGLRRYLASRLRRVKEIFRKDSEDYKDIKELDPDPQTDHVVIAVEPVLPTESPPPLPELPQPIPRRDEAYEVLRVDQEQPLPKVSKNQYNKPTRKWTNASMLKPRKILEICTWTMLISTIALEKDSNWHVCTPVSIEHGFDLLTPQGRKKGAEYIYKEKLDLIVGEWMCSPFSSLQNLNLAKGGELRDRVLHDQREHAKVSAWISQIEKWQRKVNKGMWIGELPHKCGSWKLQCLQ